MKYYVIKDNLENKVLMVYKSIDELIPKLIERIILVDSVWEVELNNINYTIIGGIVSINNLTFIKKLSLDEIVAGITTSKNGLAWQRKTRSKATIDIVTGAEAAQWAKEFGDNDIMIKRINDSVAAFWWGSLVGNHDIMIDKINDEVAAHHWAKHIGNKDEMRKKITSEGAAIFWAKELGDLNEMFSLIKTAECAIVWANMFGITSNKILDIIIDNYKGNPREKDLISKSFSKIEINITKNINNDILLNDIVPSITHFKHALTVSKSFPEVRDNFLSLIKTSKDARQWLYYFPQDIKKVEHLIETKDVYAICVNHKGLTKNLMHLVTIKNCASLISISPKNAKKIILAALKNNNGTMYPNYLFNSLEYSIGRPNRHHLAYIKHLFN